MQETLRAYPNLTIREGSVFDILLDEPNAGASSQAEVNLRIRGVKLGQLEHHIPEQTK